MGLSNQRFIYKALVSTTIVCTLSIGAVVPFSQSTWGMKTVEAASQYQEAKIVLDGQTVKLDQGAIVKNGATLVPVRGVFDALGSTISYNAASKQVTAVKGSTKIVLTIGSKTATINGVKVTLTQPAEVVNGRTLVPLRFVSEALGAKVAWNQSLSTATITSQKVVSPPSVSAGETVNSIKPLYGSHTYGVKSQAEYDKVMELIKPALKDYKTNPWYTKTDMYNDEFQRGVDDYLDNGVSAPWTGVVGDYYAGNKEIRGIKRLTDNGVSADEAVELITLHMNVSTLLKNANVSGKLSNSSAYDGLVRDIFDCGSYAYTLSAVYDSAGYSTSIIANKTHADAFLQLNNGDWYKLTGGFTYYGKNLPSGGDLYFVATPTYK